MKKIIVLLIMTLVLFGCSDNSRNEEIQAILKKDGFAVMDKDFDLEPWQTYNVSNEELSFGIGLENKKIFYILVYNDSSEMPYCVYGKNETCYSGYWDEENPDSEKNKKVLEKSKVMEKEYKAFMKKNKIKKQELVDFFQYYYDEHKDEWESED